MDDLLLDILRTVSSEYATGRGEHFVLDRLERYPGDLPFTLATTSQSDETSTAHPPEHATAPLRLDPELASEIAAEVERSRMRRSMPSEDPLDRLAEQLKAFAPTKAESTESSDAEPSLAEPTVTESEIPTADESADEHATEADAAPPTIPQRRHRRRAAVLTIVVVLAAIVAGVSLVPLQWLHPPTRSSSDTTEVLTPSASHPALALSPQSEMHQQESASTKENHTSTTAIDTLPSQLQSRSFQTPTTTGATADQAINTLTSSHTPRMRSATVPIKIAEDQPNEVAITEPPTLPPPKSDGTFVIQLCSTPSYADALRWKRFAEERAFGKQVTITERTIRQQTYYRVRVGVYGSQIEAEQAARSLGLSLADVWIVQIN